MEVDSRLHDIAAKALAGLPRKPGDDELDADGANRLRSRIVDDAVRIAELEAALAKIVKAEDEIERAPFILQARHLLASQK